MTPENQPVTKADLNAAFESFAAAFIANLSDLREEMQRRFDQVDQRLDTIDRRTDRMETHIHAVILQTGGMSKSLTDAERLDTRFAATQAAQQRAIDDLYAKVNDIQRQLKQRP
jgi:hypothetical protein